MAFRYNIARVTYGSWPIPTSAKNQLGRKGTSYVLLHSERKLAKSSRNHVAWPIKQDEAKMRLNVRKLIETIISKRDTRHHDLPIDIASGKRPVIIRVHTALLENHMDDLCASFDRINVMGQLPVIVHETMPDFHDLAAEVESSLKDCENAGVVSCKTLMATRRRLLEDNLNLVESMESCGIRAAPITSGVFKANFKDRDIYGYQGTVSDIQISQVRNAIHNNRVAVLMCMAETLGGQLLTMSADEAILALSKDLAPSKIVYLCERGGMYNAITGQQIRSVDFSENEVSTLQVDELCDKQRIEHVRALLDQAQCGLRLVMVHPSRLADEVLDERGDGTLFTRSASSGKGPILEERDRAVSPPDKFVIHDKGITSFSKLSSWIDESDGRSWHTYYDKQLEAAAVIYAPYDRDHTIARLATFDLPRHAWLNGTADEMFLSIKAEFPKLTWTLRQGHERMSWFSDQAEGRYRCGDEVTHWYGSPSEADLQSMLFG